MTDDNPYDFIDPDADASLEEQDGDGFFRRVFRRVFR